MLKVLDEAQEGVDLNSIPGVAHASGPRASLCETLCKAVGNGVGGGVL
jgi:hypothetical protein